MSDSEFDNNFDEEFARGAATALLWQAEIIDDDDVDDDDIPPAAWFAAGQVKGQLEQLNGVHIAVLGARAAEADGKGYDSSKVDAETFGHYMALESLGHGVSWFDDHEKFDVHIPNMEIHFYSEMAGEDEG